MQQHRRSRIELLVGICRDIDALHHFVWHDAERPGIAWIGDFDRGGAGVEERNLGLLHDRHDGKRCVRTFLADHDIGFELIDQAFGSLCRRQRAAGGILVLDLEFVSIYARLVELFECELNALLVLCAEIGAWARHRKKASDLDGLVSGQNCGR